MGTELERIPRPPALQDTAQPGSVPAVNWLRRNRHWTVPPLLLPPFLAAGFALAAYREHTGAVVAAVILAACVFWAAPHKWDRNAEVWYARLTAAAAGGWLAAASFTGITRVMAAVLAGLLLAWGIPWYWHKRPRSRIRDHATVAEWNAWWQHHARQWGLQGSSVTAASAKGTMDTLTIQLWRGHQTVRDVANVTELIESALGGHVAHGMARVDKVAKDPSVALLRLKREDPLAVPVTWHPGLAIARITEAAPFGFTETGELLWAHLLSNWFIIGKTRGGKSNQLSLMLASVTGCDDARVWLVDMKGGRAARPWMPAVDWCAVTADEAALMFRALVAEIKARATYADSGEEQLAPTSEVPAIFLVIDETYEVTSVTAGRADLARDLAVIASQGSGLAVHVVVLTQYGALDESVRTEQTRGNLPFRVCFAVSEARHGAFALSDYQKLDASKLREKGSFYMQLGPDRPSAPGRGLHMSHPLVRQVAARHGAMPRQPLTLYAADWQQPYDDRWSRLPQPFWKSAPQTDGLEPSSAPVLPAPARELAGASPDEAAAAAGMAQAIEDDIAGLPDTDPARMPSDEQLRSALAANQAAFCRALGAAPRAGVMPAQLIAASGLSRSQVMRQLKDLTSAGAVIHPEHKGPYWPAEGADIPAALEAVRRGDAALIAA